MTPAAWLWIPITLAAAAALPEVGSYSARDAAGTPIVVVRGVDGKVTMRSSDTLIAHTHPHGPEFFPRDIGHQGPGKPFTEASDLATKEGQNPEAIIYANGETRFYDDLGPIHGDAPKGFSPVSPDGYIDGNMH